MRKSTEIVNDITLPKMYAVRQKFDPFQLDNVSEVVWQKLNEERIRSLVKPGMTIAITAGSRGIDNMNDTLRTVIKFVRQCGAECFVFPAMGSHGGATAEGQLEILKSYGVTEETMGAPIRATMETVLVDTLEDGIPVYADKYAYEADGIIVVNRIKAHTSFRGKYESGLMKMCVIGVGKQKGASYCHQRGYGYFADRLERMGKSMLKNVNIIFGVGLIENAFDHTREVHVLTPDEIIEREPALLAHAKECMARLNFTECDLLVIDEIGKNISGSGADPNITGTVTMPNTKSNILTNHMTILDVTPESHGAAVGIGMASSTTQRLFDKIDYDAIYANILTSTNPVLGKIPAVMENDKAAIQAGIRFSGVTDPEKIKMIRIKNTLEVQDIMISPALYELVKDSPDFELLGKPVDLEFDEMGNII